jgi:glucose-6-phosphate dehydrogenase assembly protein OpcA
MASLVVERVWRASSPETVEGDLAALWRDVGGGARIARAVMSNLVIYRRRRDSGSQSAEMLQTDAAIEAVVARHPSRVVLVEHDGGESDPAVVVSASVGVALFGPQTARYAVDQIAVRSTCVETSLPSIVRRCIRGDLPTSIWWTEDLSNVPPIDALMEIGRQLVYDSRRWRDVQRGVRVVAPLLEGRRIDLADLNWRRLAPLRQALVHAAPSLGATPSPSHVRIAYRSGDEALASLLTGWLAARLDWALGAWPEFEEAARNDEVLSITVESEASTLTASMSEHRVIVNVSGAKPFIVRVPQWDEAEAIAAELRSLSYDAGLHDALLALARRSPQT